MDGNMVEASRGTILDEIVRWKRVEVRQRQDARPLHIVQGEMLTAPAPRDMVGALRAPGVSLIAEVKRASPSRGSLREDLDPAELARAYQAHGARAVSVLTDERYFQGSLADLRAVRGNVSVPVLRKDFVLDPYQVYEARAAGADAVLLIVAALSDQDVASLHRLVYELGMSALVEVHNRAELERALQIRPRLVGVNNRDLHTFHVDLENTAYLRPLVPEGVVVVAESGVHTQADVRRLAQIGVDAMLVGESLVRAADLGAKVRELLSEA
jgi:indole-3-glycerol phosphate synthase